MYLSYFGLVAAPFSIAPDPRYLYMSQRHQEALATLLYGLRSHGGFVLLTGEVGAGKTTICRCLLQQIPEACDVAYLFNPKLTVVELLSTICDEFGIAYQHGTTSIKRFVDLINAYLLDSHASGRRAVLIIDEAQNLSADVLEQMRLLTNLETDQRKLLQIVMLGQPELINMLARPELRQLAQRIVARYHLKALDKNEVAAYVRHRLQVSGAQHQLFPDGLWNRIYKLSGGIPRVINVLCDRALLGAYVQGKERVDRSTLAQAAREVLNRRPWRRLVRLRTLLACAFALVAGLQAVSLYRQHEASEQAATAQQATSLAASQSFPLQTSMPPSHSLNAGDILPATLELPPDVSIRQSRHMAFSTLLQAWGAHGEDDVDPCSHAEALGLQCRSARGGLGELRQLDMPVVLHLLNADGHVFYAALTALEGNFATFSFGNRAKNVSLSAFALQWSGDYTMLLPLPPHVRENAPAGERGATIDWLRKQLAQAEGGIPATGPAVFDVALQRKIKQFQLAQGLTPDGLVGFKTLARLAVLSNRSAPRLSHAGGGS